MIFKATVKSMKSSSEASQIIMYLIINVLYIVLAMLSIRGVARVNRLVGYNPAPVMYTGFDIIGFFVDFTDFLLDFSLIIGHIITNT